MCDKTNVKKSQLSSDSEKGCLQKQPKDAYRAVFLLFFAFGLMHFLPWIFLTNAHQYWMYKFRDVSDKNYDPDDPNNLNWLQKNFSTFLTVTNQSFAIVSTFFSLFFAHKFSYRFKLFYIIAFILLLFILLTIFIEINTDPWQIGFFALVMVFVAEINFANYTFGMHNYSILAQFPSNFIKPYVNGQGLAAVFSSILQIASLGVGASTTSCAMIYFCVGATFIAMTLLYATCIDRNNKFYRHQMSTYQDSKKEKTLSFKEIKNMLGKVYPAVLILLGYLLTTSPVLPACTSLIASTDAGNGHPWNDVYFIPVIGFLIPALGDVSGRILASLLPNVFSIRTLMSFSFGRIFVFVPLVILCNVPGKTHVPTVFDDTGYIIIMIVFSISNGFAVGMCSFVMPMLVEPDEMEDAFHVYTVATELLLGATAFIGFISVNLL